MSRKISAPMLRTFLSPTPILRRFGIAFLLASLISSLVFTLLPADIAFAVGSFAVNTTSDSHCTGFSSQGAPGCSSATDSGGNISLRSALEFANTSGGTTTISVPQGTYNLSLGDLVAGTQANTNITVHGTGTAANTIINQTTPGRMVIVQNFNVNSNVVLQLDNITISGGKENENDPDGFGGNGGAVLAGGSATATGVAVSLTNMVFSSNYCSPVSNAGCSGGAISMTGGGNLTVLNSTFSSNDASKNSGTGSGGAIYFDNGGNPGNVSITNSIFTNNTAHNSGGQGGAVRLAGGAGSTYTVNNNIFTGNAAAQNGGALYLSLGGLTANFNRIVGNTSNSGSGLYVANNSGSLGAATNNWWGCNGGPGAAPCDTAVLGTPNQGGSMTVNPWIILSDAANPNPIQVNQTTTLAADFLHNSNGGALTTAQISVLIGLPVSWGNAVNGSLSNLQTSIQANGTSTATFTATAAGAGKAGASVDNGTGTGSITINKADTVTVITSESPDPTVTGQGYIVNFSLTSNTGSIPTAPTGTVTVSDGTVSCNGTLAIGTCTLTSTTAGAKLLTATYSGDGNFNVSSSTSVAHTVNKADTTTAITADTPDPSVVGQTVPVHYSVTVNSPGGGTPTGNVTVSDGTDSCTGTISGGQCSLTFTSPGAVLLTATYAGDSNYNGSASVTEPHQINKADTSTTITSDNPDPSNAGQAVTVNYTVVAKAPGSGTPTGNVTVSDGVDSCTGTVLAGTCNITLTTQGARTLTASYAGDGNFNGSTSAGEPHTVNKFDTSTVIVSHNPDPSVVGQVVTVQYTVSPSVVSGTPTGTVVVSDGTISCSGTVAAGQCSLTFTSAGTRSLTATYSGDSNFNSSTSSIATHTVNPANTTTTITSDNPDPSNLGQSVTVQYSVSVNSPGVGTPTGIVTVSDGTVSCTGTVVAGLCNLTFTIEGIKTLTASYAGDANFNGSTSAGEPHNVNAAPAIILHPGNLTVNAGQLASFTAAASGFPTPTVQWQISTDGGATWNNISGATAATLSFATTAGNNGNQYRAVFTNIVGTATSNAATLTVNFAPTVIANPTDLSVIAGQTASFTAASTGNPNPTVQWQVSTDGGATFTNISGATATTLSFTAAQTDNGSKYRAVFTNSLGSATTSAATLNVGIPPIVTQNPTDLTVNVGQTATFTAASSGNPTPTVQWQVSTDGGATFSNISGATSTTLSFTAAFSQTGNKYRAVFTNGAGSAITSAALLTVRAPTSMLYNGGQIVNIGSSFTPAALLSSSVIACTSGKTLNFALDTNPLTGVAGPYPLGTATTNSSGQATMSPVTTTGWIEGIYTISASFAGSVNCLPSSDSATLTVASPGDSANGGGWYTLSGSGRVNFGFTVRKTDPSCTINCSYKGQLLLINNGKWKLKATLNAYSKLSTGQGAASGTGSLYWWNQSLNGGLGDWALAQSGVNFTINFYDSGTSGKSSTDTFGINIQYKPVSPQPSNLPNSTPQLLKGGNIVVK